MPKAKPALSGGWKSSVVRVAVQRTVAPGIAPPKRYRASARPWSDCPEITSVEGVVTSTLNCGGRYSSTRKLALVESLSEVTSASARTK